MTIPQFCDISLSDNIRLDYWLQSKPSEVIRAFKQVTVYSLCSIEAVRLLAKTNPHRYELLVAEAIAQGFPIN